jgi:membrane-associated phospholipid phosphatase
MGNSNHILFIFDYISALPICIYTSLLYTSTIQQDVYPFIFFIQLLIVDIFLVPFLKHLPYPSFIYNLTRRPKGATNCDYLSKIPSKTNAPGLPSGHMTVTSMFSIVKMLENKSNISIVLHTCIIILMGISRYYKKCHNIVQIIAGTILGLILGYISFHLYNN